MTEIQIFNNYDFGKIRTLEENGQVLFCGSDVAKALGYTNSQKAQISYPAFKRAWEGQSVKIATIGKIAKALGVAVQDIIE